MPLYAVEFVEPVIYQANFPKPAGDLLPEHGAEGSGHRLITDLHVNAATEEAARAHAIRVTVGAPAIRRVGLVDKLAYRNWRRKLHAGEDAGPRPEPIDA